MLAVRVQIPCFYLLGLHYHLDNRLRGYRACEPDRAADRLGSHVYRIRLLWGHSSSHDRPRHCSRRDWVPQEAATGRPQILDGGGAHPHLPPPPAAKVLQLLLRRRSQLRSAAGELHVKLGGLCPATSSGL